MGRSTNEHNCKLREKTKIALSNKQNHLSLVFPKTPITSMKLDDETKRRFPCDLQYAPWKKNKLETSGKDSSWFW